MQQTPPRRPDEGLVRCAGGVVGQLTSEDSVNDALSHWVHGTRVVAHCWLWPVAGTSMAGLRPRRESSSPCSACCPVTLTGSRSTLSDALKSSLQRNPTYTPGTTEIERARFRSAWRDELIVIAGEYVKATKRRAGFEADVLRLQATMNARFGSMLQPRSARYLPGFRIAHSQKSLSLVLKHYWCHDKIDEPPACPVDRIMLREAHAPYPLRTWTTVNTIEKYRIQLGILETAATAKGQSVAVWELLEFK